MQRAFVLAGATVTPGFSIDVLAAEVAGASRQLDARRFALLSALADTIVPRTDSPGAVDAGVPALVDGLLRNWASPSRRAELIAALDRIEGLAGPGGASFARLAPQVRHDLLTTHDAAALTPRPTEMPAAASLKRAPTVVDPNYGRPKQDPAEGKAPASLVGEAGGTARSKPPAVPSFMRGPVVADADYAKLKELIVVLYYYSEPALTKELPYEHVPGAWQPSIPITAETRPWGGAGNV
ncbi:MAG: gluconate 2-dehydrogenase subunit 3 family protein [Novosphingobium sp.]